MIMDGNTAEIQIGTAQLESAEYTGVAKIPRYHINAATVAPKPEADLKKEEPSKTDQPAEPQVTTVSANDSQGADLASSEGAEKIPEHSQEMGLKSPYELLLVQHDLDFISALTAASNRWSGNVLEGDRLNEAFVNDLNAFQQYNNYKDHFNRLNDYAVGGMRTEKKRLDANAFLREFDKDVSENPQLIEELNRLNKKLPKPKEFSSPDITRKKTSMVNEFGLTALRNRINIAHISLSMYERSLRGESTAPLSAEVTELAGVAKNSIIVRSNVHSAKNIFNAIKGDVYFIQKPDINRATLEEYLKKLPLNLERLRTLLISAHRELKIGLTREEFKVEPFAIEFNEAVQQHCDGANLVLNKTITVAKDTGEKIFWNTPQYRSVIDNIVSNAASFYRKRGDSNRVLYIDFTQPTSEYLEIRVRDLAGGFTKELAEAGKFSVGVGEERESSSSNQHQAMGDHQFIMEEYFEITMHLSNWDGDDGRKGSQIIIRIPVAK